MAGAHPLSVLLAAKAHLRRRRRKVHARSFSQVSSPWENSYAAPSPPWSASECWLWSMIWTSRVRKLCSRICDSSGSSTLAARDALAVSLGRVNGGRWERTGAGGARRRRRNLLRRRRGCAGVLLRARLAARGEPAESTAAADLGRRCPWPRGEGEVSPLDSDQEWAKAPRNALLVQLLSHPVRQLEGRARLELRMEREVNRLAQRKAGRGHV